MLDKIANKIDKMGASPPDMIRAWKMMSEDRIVQIE